LVSKFVEELKARIVGGDRRPALGPIKNFSFSEKFEKATDYAELTHYIISTTFDMHFTCVPSDVMRAKRIATDHLLEAIYGELFGMVLEAEKAVIDGDREAALKALDQIRREMR
jgi:hypothetical protein